MNSQHLIPVIWFRLVVLIGFAVFVGLGIAVLLGILTGWQLITAYNRR
ncbi:hypothetical protein ACL1EU_09010 [Corynebacterium striatum]